MALAKRQSNSTRFAVIGVVVAVVAGIGYLVYKEFFLTPPAAVSNTVNATKQVITNFGESILNDPRYTSLRSYEVTVNADANTDGGQPQPFQ